MRARRRACCISHASPPSTSARGRAIRSRAGTRPRDR
jgi:hypothetical protein